MVLAYAIVTHPARITTTTTIRTTMAIPQRGDIFTKEALKSFLQKSILVLCTPTYWKIGGGRHY